jgi:hypothetical protein
LIFDVRRQQGIILQKNQQPSVTFDLALPAKGLTMVKAEAVSQRRPRQD